MVTKQPRNQGEGPQRKRLVRGSPPAASPGPQPVLLASPEAGPMQHSFGSSWAPPPDTACRTTAGRQPGCGFTHPPTHPLAVLPNWVFQSPSFLLCASSSSRTVSLLPICPASPHPCLPPWPVPTYRGTWRQVRLGQWCQAGSQAGHSRPQSSWELYLRYCLYQSGSVIWWNSVPLWDKYQGPQPEGLNPPSLSSLHLHCLDTAMFFLGLFPRPEYLLAFSQVSSAALAPFSRTFQTWGPSQPHPPSLTLNTLIWTTPHITLSGLQSIFYQENSKQRKLQEWNSKTLVFHLVILALCVCVWRGGWQGGWRGGSSKGIPALGF